MTHHHIKALLGCLNVPVRRALETAAGMSVARGNPEVTVEHFLLSILESGNGDWECILNQYAIDLPTLRTALTREIDRLHTGSGGRPIFNVLLLNLIAQGWLISSLEFKHSDLRSGSLLIALISDTNAFTSATWIELLSPLSRKDLLNQFNAIVKNSHESPVGTLEDPVKSATHFTNSGDSLLGKFCIDFTAKAREGKLDPVFGRDHEIRQIIDILARRRKNNPILIGEPGVGKTALIEGLAIMIAEGYVPHVLRDVRLVGLDLSLLQAGASAKGEFEHRLKGVLEEVQSSTIPIILFVDEAHTLIGAGGSAGTGDAANLLKPALARGELRTIAATTWAEYKKYFERDAALARRFQAVTLDEPGVETTHSILRGLRPIYEKAHGVLIRDDALFAAAEMGARYITGRHHPDKGIDVIDTAAARVKVALASKPPALQDCERRIQEAENSLTSLARDVATGSDTDPDMITDMQLKLYADRLQAEHLNTQWKCEKSAANSAIIARNNLEQSPHDSIAQETFAHARHHLSEVQGGNPLLHIEVSPDIVARVISDWTGVPVGSLIVDEAAKLLTLEREFRQRVHGQDHVMEVVAARIRSAKAGLTDPRQPLGVFLFVGPSGVGKTETALAIADVLFGGERFMTTVNMSEYQEKHSLSRLVGSPPGYVGYGEGGILTEAIRKRPYSVVLLDEVEKADPEVLNLFYQVFDQGTLCDGEGRVIDFRNTAIILTSNLASDLISEACQGHEIPTPESLLATIRPVLSQHFKPALLARMTIVPFFPLPFTVLREITRIKLEKIVRRVYDGQKIDLTFSDEVIATITARCTETEAGARHVDLLLATHLMPLISTEILSHMSLGGQLTTLRVDLASGHFTIAGQ